MKQTAWTVVRDDGVAGSNPATPRPECTGNRTDIAISPVTVARFWSKVAVTDHDEECWLWRGAFAGSGYGSFKVPEIGRRSMSAHRLAYALACGWPKDGLIVRHKCDNPKCVNPFHLETGTHLDNSRDMLDRGRQAHRVQAGGQNYNAKLTAEQVVEVRRLIEAGVRNTVIAKRFGVHHATISRIKTGGTWLPRMSAPIETAALSRDRREPE